MGTPVGIGINNGRTIPDSAFWASSSMPGSRGAFNGRLEESKGSFCTPRISSKKSLFDQKLNIPGHGVIIYKLRAFAIDGSTEIRIIYVCKNIFVLHAKK